MKSIIKLILIHFLLVLPINLSSASEKTAMIDINYIIQNSNIGKNALKNIEDLNKKNISYLEKKNKNLKDLETKIKNKKNIISKEEFNNEVKDFQQKVQVFTEEKDKIVKDFKKFQKNELEKVFELLNPIISNYMKQNSVNILIDSKNVFMTNEDSNLTEVILKKVNNET